MPSVARPCPRADPPLPRPSRSASEVARSRLCGLPHAPQSQPCFFTTTSLSGSSYSPAVPLFFLSLSGSRPSLLPRDSVRPSSQHGSHESSRFSAISPLPRFVVRLARSDSPQSGGLCPRADPPSPRPSRSASEVAWSRLRGLPHAPQSQRPRPVFLRFLRR